MRKKNLYKMQKKTLRPRDYEKYGIDNDWGAFLVTPFIYYKNRIDNSEIGVLAYAPNDEWPVAFIFEKRRGEKAELFPLDGDEVQFYAEALMKCASILPTSK